MRRKWLPVHHPAVFAVSPSAKHNFAFAVAAGITAEDEAYFVEPVPSEKPRFTIVRDPLSDRGGQTAPRCRFPYLPIGLCRVSHRVDISPLSEQRSTMIRDKITFSPLGFASSHVARFSVARAHRSRALSLSLSLFLPRNTPTTIFRRYRRS